MRPTVSGIALGRFIWSDKIIWISMEIEPNVGARACTLQHLDPSDESALTPHMRLVTLAWAAALLPLTAGLRLRGTASAFSLAPHLAARASRGTRAIVLQAGSNGGSAPDR